jgi:hypothetical protein
MTNPFDQFDEVPERSYASSSGGNRFDQFDEPSARASGNIFDQFDEPQPPRAPKEAPGTAKQFVDSVLATIRGAADTATFGMNERSQAVLASLIDALQGKGFDYSENLAHQRGVTEYAKGQAPISFTGGQLLGGATFPAGAAAQGATLAARLGRGALAGATQGGLYGAGSSPDLTNLPDVAKNAAVGAGIGGTIGGLSVPVAGALSGGVNRHEPQPGSRAARCRGVIGAQRTNSAHFHRPWRATSVYAIGAQSRRFCEFAATEEVASGSGHPR